MKGLRRYAGKAAIADNLMGQIGISINYGKMLKLVAGQVIVGFSAIALMIAVVSVIVLVGESPLYIRIIISIIMSFPILTMFVSDAMFTSCVRLVIGFYLNCLYSIWN